MNQKQIKDIKRRVEALLKKWHEPLGLGWYDITIFYQEKPHSENENIAMQCNAAWEYRRASIDVFPRSYVFNDEELEYALLHECMHILISETREKGIKHEERVACDLAKAFKWVYEAGEKNVKRAKRSSK